MALVLGGGGGGERFNNGLPLAPCGRRSTSSVCLCGLPTESDEAEIASVSQVGSGVRGLGDVPVSCPKKDCRGQSWPSHGSSQGIRGILYCRMGEVSFDQMLRHGGMCSSCCSLVKVFFAKPKAQCIFPDVRQRRPDVYVSRVFLVCKDSHLGRNQVGAKPCQQSVHVLCGVYVCLCVFVCVCLRMHGIESLHIMACACNASDVLSRALGPHACFIPPQRRCRVRSRTSVRIGGPALGCALHPLGPGG